MLTKTYTMVISKGMTDENFRQLISIIGKCGNIKKISTVDEMESTVIKIESGMARWQMLLGRLSREMNVIPYKMLGCWFV